MARRVRRRGGMGSGRVGDGVAVVPAKVDAVAEGTDPSWHYAVSRVLASERIGRNVQERHLESSRDLLKDR